MQISCLNFLFESFMKCKSRYFVNTFYQQFKQLKQFQNFSISNIQFHMEIWIFCLNYLNILYHLSIVLKTYFPLCAIIAVVEWPCMIHSTILCKYTGGKKMRSFHFLLLRNASYFFYSSLLYLEIWKQVQITLLLVGADRKKGFWLIWEAYI